MADLVLPLTGVRVLAVEQYGAGPFGTQHLADLGAEVVKVESRRTGGDYARTLGPYFADGACEDEGSLFFQSVNRSKKSVSLDLASSAGREVFQRLVAISDAVANNLRGDVPERLGLTYASLHSANPAIVCAHCSAYGRDGPRRDWPGYDFLMQAEAGYFFMSGEPGENPARMGLSVVDFMAGTYLALGLVAGVLSARKTGRGRDIDVNLYDTAVFNMSYLGTWALNSDYAPNRIRRSAHPSLVPCQLFRTADGWIYIMCNKEKFWQRLCEGIGMPELATDPQFLDFEHRRAERERLTRILENALMADTTDGWLAKLQGRVPVAPVRTPRQAITCEDLARRDRIETVELESGSKIRMLRNPIRTGSPTHPRSCPPTGANSREYLRKAGYSEKEMDRLERKGII